MRVFGKNKVVLDRTGGAGARDMNGKAGETGVGEIGMKRDFNEHTITEAVIDRFGDTPDPRLKQILVSLVKHAHDFVRDVELTFPEWQKAVDFLTRTGQISGAKRQEFILLSDVFGVSMLTDAINHRMPAGATETTVLGPFFVEGAPELENGADMSGGFAGEALFVSGTVSAADGTKLGGAVIDVWHSDQDGFYDVQYPDKDEMAMRARFRSDAAGRFHFRTIQPEFYPIPYDGPVGELLVASKRHPYRPAHVHFIIAAPGFETLVTHVFVQGDKYLDSDAVFGVKDSLIREFVRHEAGTVMPDGQVAERSWRSLHYDFGLKPLAAEGGAET
jgi:hydroxyquinol 1,2-dioxygenase